MTTIICNVCNNEIDVAKFKGKTKAFQYAREQGWVIGRGYLCPEHRNYYKDNCRKKVSIFDKEFWE